MSAGLREAIVAAAREAGAGAVRIAPAEPLSPARERMEASFARGDLATWQYDAAYAERASDPQALLAGARSVVCIAVAYASPAGAVPRGLGRVSNYAWSRDYHRAMRDVLAVLDPSDVADILAEVPYADDAAVFRLLKRDL